MKISRRQFMVLSAAGLIAGLDPAFAAHAPEVAPAEPLPALARDTWYHLFTIVDEGTPLPIPSMDELEEYTLNTDIKVDGMRRIGSVLTDDKGRVRPFEMFDSKFNFTTPVPSPLSAPTDFHVETHGWIDPKLREPRRP